MTDAAWHAKGSCIFLRLGALGSNCSVDTDALENQDPPSPYVTAPSIALAGRSESPRVLTEPEIKDYIYAPTKTMGNTYMVSDLMAETVTTLTTSFKYPAHTRVDGVETKIAGHDWGRRSLMLPWITSVQSDLLSYLSWSTLHSKGT